MPKMNVEKILNTEAELKYQEEQEQDKYNLCIVYHIFCKLNSEICGHNYKLNRK